MNYDLQAFSNMSPSNFSGRYTQFHEFLDQRQLALLQEADVRRSQIDSLEKLQTYTRTMRETFIEKMGGIPKRDCPLDAKTLNVIDMGGYTIESVLYSARTGVYVTSSLYLPKNLQGPSAAVLFLSGHTDTARMDAGYQAVCQTLVNAGLIVFAIDTVGQGERNNFYDPATSSYTAAHGVEDHDFCGVPSLCTGRFIESYFMNDQMSAVDYMLTRPEIDPAKIGVTGCSGGGLQSLCMMTCDHRIAAAAPATFTTTRRDILYSCQSQDSEQIWPGCAAYGFDHFEPFYIFAPKPALILTVSSDFFPIEGAYEVYDAAKKIYGLYGKEENLCIFEDPACHGYTLPLAKAAAAFFCRVFGVEQRPEKPLHPLPEKVLQCTRTGNVKGDFQDARTLPEETDLLAAELKKNRTAGTMREWLWEKVNHGRIPCDTRPRISDEATKMQIGPYTGKSVMWWVQKQLSAYGVLIYTNSDESSPVVIALWDHGTKAIKEHEDWIKAQCAENHRVLVVDLPGNGNIEQAFLWGWSPYRARYGTQYKLCCDLMYMDDSMAAMQTYHVLRTVDMLRAYWKVQDISLYCAKQEGVYGIMAGYLTGLHREYGEDLLSSVEKQILSQRPLRYDNTLSYVIPGMLAYFDYDELMGSDPKNERSDASI